jgi:hypothetical protein
MVAVTQSLIGKGVEVVIPTASLRLPKESNLKESVPLLLSAEIFGNRMIDNKGSRRLLWVKLFALIH